MLNTGSFLLWWFAIIAAGLSVGLAVWGVGTWGQAQSVHRRTARIRHLVRRDEPLLPQLWRFVKVVASARTVGQVVGSLRAFDRVRLDNLLVEARQPWGMNSASDVYATGLALGAVIQGALAYLTGFNFIVLAMVPVSIVAGLGMPVLILKVMAAGTRQAMIRELWTLMSGLEVYLQAGNTMYDALREAGAACPLLSTYIDRALLGWGAIGPGAALDELGRELRLPEAFLVIGAIRQAVDQDPVTLLAFMMRESTRLDKAMEAAQARSSQIKPMLQNALLMLPAFNIFILMTAPWAYSVFDQLQGGVGNL